MSHVLHVNLASDSYDIIIKKDSLKDISDYIKDIAGGERIAVITDENVAPHYAGILEKSLEASGYTTKTIVMPAGEATKSIDNLPEIYRQLIEFEMTRSDSIIALGGGVIGDLGGYVAATYLRGIKYIQIPTTLLSQVDSSVGGKVAVNLKQGKNLVGCFYQPKIVIIDPNVLDTLSDRYFIDGMAEVIKYGCVFDSEFFLFLESLKTKENFMENIEHIIAKSLMHKRAVVQNDVYDTGERMLLNFGHTLGHAVESYYNYSRYTHGEAVAIGMAEITEYSEKIGITKQGTAKAIKDLLCAVGLETEMDTHDREEIAKHVVFDKKRLDGVLKLVLLEDIGRGVIRDSSVDFLK